MTKPRFLSWPVAGMVCSICLLSLCDAALASAQGFRAFALSDNSLITLDTAQPAAPATPMAVTGLNAGDTLVGIDVRPMNGMLYGLGYNSGAGAVQLYAINYWDGTAAPVGVANTFVDAGGNPVSIQGTHFGFDFDASTDRIRVVNDAGQNFRMNPNTGALIDGDLGGPPGSVLGLNMDGSIHGQATAVSGGAHTNNEQNANRTTFFTLGATAHALYIQSPASSGTQTTALTVTLNGSTLAFSDTIGFDIAPGVDVATSDAEPPAGSSGYAALNVAGVTSLYTIDLNTGVATSIGTIGDGTHAVQALAIQGEDVPAGLPAIAAGIGTLHRFNTKTPGTTSDVVVTGLVAGEVLSGLDWRPKTGQLYALGTNSGLGTGSATLYRLDPKNGAASIIGTASDLANGAGAPIDLGGATVFGFSFDSDADQARVVTNNGKTFRIDPTTGTVVNGALDPGIDGLPPGSPGLTAGAFSLGGPPSTNPPLVPPVQFFGLDPTTNRLLQQSSNPASFQLDTAGARNVTVNGNLLDFDGATGFDIPFFVRACGVGCGIQGPAYAILSAGGADTLFRINLLDGRATALSAFGAANSIVGLTLGTGPLNPTTTAVIPSLNPSPAGASVTFTVAVSPAAATGTISLAVGGFTVSCTHPQVTAGSATCDVPFPTAGNFTIIATYSGDENHVSSTSAPITQQISAPTLAPTTTMLTISPNPANNAQLTTLTASVTPVNATGTVTFSSDGTPIGTIALTNGTASVTIAPPPTSHDIVAVYSGDTSFAGSTSATVRLIVEPSTFTQYFAEGATGGFFHTDLGILNASATESAQGQVTFLLEDGTSQVSNFTLTPLGRMTVDVNATVANASGVSMVVTSDHPVAATRQMTWGSPVYGSTLESGAPGTATTWYFAEGSTNIFSLFYLIENPNAQPAHVTFMHLQEVGGNPVVQQVVVPALSRQTYYINDVPGLRFAAVSTTVTSDVPVVAERAMYLNTSNRLWEGGTSGHGATALSNVWSFAEGATGSFFHTYLLVGNPNDGTTTVTTVYLLPDGREIVKSHDMAGRSRMTIDVASEDALLASTSVGMLVSSTLPVVAERAMWWGDPFTDGSVSLGSTVSGYTWAIGEGAEGGPSGEATFVLVSNNAFDDPVIDVTVAYDDGTHESKRYTPPKKSRMTVRIGDDFPNSHDKRFSVLIDSVLLDPITVEYARYQSPGGSFLDAGGAALAVRIK